MPKTTKTLSESLTEPADQSAASLFSSVILDFELIEGCLYLCIYNYADEPFLEVQITPGKDFHRSGQHGNARSLSIFKHISYLAPRKRIAVFLDQASLFFQQQQDLKIPFLITYKNAAKQTFKSAFTHDLAIYKDLPFHSSATII